MIRDRQAVARFLIERGVKPTFLWPLRSAMRTLSGNTWTPIPIASHARE